MENIKNLLKDKKHIHFIGIGGAGMFPLAQILNAKGYYLTGSDNNESDTLTLVRKLGIPVFMGHNKDNIVGADLVVYSAAIMESNPEREAAFLTGIEQIERSILLGFITYEHKNTYGICGTHGKTTVSSMLTQILMYAKKDPSAIIGGKLPLINGNGRAGQNDLLVCESCEYVDTFLKLYPAVAVILNIDADHMEYFKTMQNLKKSFTKFAQKATRAIIYNGDDKNSSDAVKNLEKPKITFGFQTSNNFYPENIRVSQGKSCFTLIKNGEKFAEIALVVPGRHNILNAIAAVAAADYENVPSSTIQNALADFKGAGRRFEHKGDVLGFSVYDDYAHHPAEIEVTLNAAKTLGFGKVWAIFQPFTFSRTKMLLNDFAKALSLADKVVLAPIMGSREINTYNIYSEDLAKKIPGAVVIQTFDEIADYIKKNAKSGDMIITIGCGDIYKAGKLILK